MYSIVLATAVTMGAGGATSWGHHGCFGGGGYAFSTYGNYFGGCHGCYGGCYGCAGGCYGGGNSPAYWGGYGCYGNCYGCYGSSYGGWFGCYGSYSSGYAAYGSSGYGGSYGGCYGCYGSCYGCYGGGYGSYGCYGSWNGCYGCYGVAAVSSYSTPVYMASTSSTVSYGVSVAQQQPQKTISGAEPATVASKSQPAPAQVTVHLPADAKLYVDEVNCPLTSDTRSFATPNLKQGQKFYYEVRAEVVRAGATVTETQRVVLEAGKQVSVTFPKLGPVVAAER